MSTPLTACHLSLRGVAPVDDQLTPRDKRRLIRGQIQHAIRNIFCRADAAQRRPPYPVLPGSGDRQGAFRHWGVNKSRMHRVTPYAILGVLSSGGLRQQAYRAFGGGVGARTRPKTHQSRDGGDVDNRPSSSLTHGGNGLLGPQKHPLRIHIQHQVPRRFSRVFQADLFPTSTGPTNAGIIHQDIQLAIAVDCRAHGLDPIGLAGHIQMHVRRLSTLLPYLLLHLLSHLVEEVTQHHFCPFARKEFGFNSTLASGTAADQCDFPIQSSHGSIPPTDSVGTLYLQPSWPRLAVPSCTPDSPSAWPHACVGRQRSRTYAAALRCVPPLSSPVATMRRCRDKS